jgi:hypothetical protein
VGLKTSSINFLRNNGLTKKKAFDWSSIKEHNKNELGKASVSIHLTREKDKYFTGGIFFLNFFNEPKETLNVRRRCQI